MIGSHNGDVDPEDTIKIKPDKSVPGQFVNIHKPVKKGVLSLSDVKVYVKPIKDTEEPEMIGTYNLQTQELRKADGTVENWYSAELFKMDW